MQGWTQQTAFTSLEMAQEFQRKVKEYHARYNNQPYVGAKYKIMEREITEWRDLQKQEDM